MDPSLLTIFTVMGGAVAALFGLWSAFLVRRNKVLEEDNEALEKENKRLTAMIVTAAETAEGVHGLRDQLARMLRGD